MHFIKIVVDKTTRYIDIEGADIVVLNNGGVDIYSNIESTDNYIHIEPENAIRLIRHLDMISANMT